MSKLKDLVRYENANSALSFRATPYDADDRQSLLIDLLALANAQVSGPRVLVLGVDDEVGGDRRLGSVDLKAVARLARSYKQTVKECVSPTLNLSFSSLIVEDRDLAVIVLRDCGAQPYALSCDVSPDLATGTSWIRRGSHQTQLTASELEALFGTGSPGGESECKPRVFFEGPKLSSSIELPALPLSSKPSELARQRIEGQLEAKKAAHDRLGATDTWLDRLTFARLHGPDKPYETQTQVSLLVQLGQTDTENEAADKYYECELRAHMINLVIANAGSGSLTGVSVVVDLPVMSGVTIADKIYPPVGVGPEEIPRGYPNISFGSNKTQIASKLDSIEPGSRLKVFKQPLRLLLRESAVGRKLRINYTVLGKELAEPLIGSLQVAVTKSDERHMNVCVQP